MCAAGELPSPQRPPSGSPGDAEASHTPKECLPALLARTPLHSSRCEGQSHPAAAQGGIQAVSVGAGQCQQCRHEGRWGDGADGGRKGKSGRMKQERERYQPLVANIQQEGWQMAPLPSSLAAKDLTFPKLQRILASCWAENSSTSDAQAWTAVDRRAGLRYPV